MDGYRPASGAWVFPAVALFLWEIVPEPVQGFLQNPAESGHAPGRLCAVERFQDLLAQGRIRPGTALPRAKRARHSPDTGVGLDKAVPRIRRGALAEEGRRQGQPVSGSFQPANQLLVHVTILKPVRLTFPAPRTNFSHNRTASPETLRVCALPAPINRREQP